MRRLFIVKYLLKTLEILAALVGASLLMNFIIHQRALLSVSSGQISSELQVSLQATHTSQIHLPPKPCPNWERKDSKYTVVGYSKVNSSKCIGSACHLNWNRQSVIRTEYPDPCLDVVECLTVTIKTRYRYKTLSYFLETLWKFYPGLKVIIADEVNGNLQSDGRGWFQDHVMHNTSGLVTYFQARPGVGHGRHLAVKLASTKYVLVVDDDFIVTNRTNLKKLLEVIEYTDLDIVAGDTSDTFPYVGAIRVAPPTQSNPNNSLHLVLYPHIFYDKLPCFTDCYRTDIVKTFFLANQKSILQAGSWDSSRMFYEHEDFFIQMRHSRLKVAFCNDVVITHRSSRNLLEKSLASLRRASHDVWKTHLLTKWNINDYYICPKEYYKHTDFTCPTRHQRHFS